MKTLSRLLKNLRRRRELSTPVLFRPAEPPVNVWAWPKSTWFQQRRRMVR